MLIMRILRILYRLALQLLIGILGISLADRFINGVVFQGTLKQLLIIGAVLGFINFFLKPVLNAITLPLRILTLGLFTFVINMLMVWIVDALFAELDIIGIIPLFWTAIIFWITGILLSSLAFFVKRLKKIKKRLSDSRGFSS